MRTIKLGCLQLCSSDNIDANLNKVAKLCEQAKKDGVELLLTPENVCRMPISLQEGISLDSKNPIVMEFQKIAQVNQLMLVLGSVIIRDEQGRSFNRSYFIDKQGTIIATYDKIHLFKAYLTDQEAYNESEFFLGGVEATVVKHAMACFGMSICYDLRFPLLYQQMAKKGSEIIFVPSAFTKMTGQAHWKVLLRARAIENGSFILAANQTGMHSDGKETYGHSMIISPWGEVIASMGSEEGVISATINVDDVKATRKKITNLENSTKFSVKKIVVEEIREENRHV